MTYKIHNITVNKFMEALERGEREQYLDNGELSYRFTNNYVKGFLDAIAQDNLKLSADPNVSWYFSEVNDELFLVVVHSGEISIWRW